MFPRKKEKKKNEKEKGVPDAFEKCSLAVFLQI